MELTGSTNERHVNMKRSELRSIIREELQRLREADGEKIFNRNQTSLVRTGRGDGPKFKQPPKYTIPFDLYWEWDSCCGRRGEFGKYWNHKRVRTRGKKAVEAELSDGALKNLIGVAQTLIKDPYFKSDVSPQAFADTKRFYNKFKNKKFKQRGI